MDFHIYALIADTGLSLFFSYCMYMGRQPLMRDKLLMFIIKPTAPEREASNVLNKTKCPGPYNSDGHGAAYLMK